MLAERRLEALTPEPLRETDSNWELISGIALGAGTGIGFAAALLLIGYYLDLDGTRLILQMIFR